MSDYKDYLENGAAADWAQYPTYTAYEQIMEKWQEDYPELAKMHDLGPSGMETHRIYAMQLSDNVSQYEQEPSFLFTGTVKVLHWIYLSGRIYPLKIYALSFL